MDYSRRLEIWGTTEGNREAVCGAHQTQICDDILAAGGRGRHGPRTIRGRVPAKTTGGHATVRPALTVWLILGPSIAQNIVLALMWHVAVFMYDLIDLGRRRIASPALTPTLLQTDIKQDEPRMAADKIAVSSQAPSLNSPRPHAGMPVVRCCATAAQPRYSFRHSSASNRWCGWQGVKRDNNAGVRKKFIDTNQNR